MDVLTLATLARLEVLNGRRSRVVEVLLLVGLFSCATLGFLANVVDGFGNLLGGLKVITFKRSDLNSIGFSGGFNGWLALVEVHSGSVGAQKGHHQE